MKVTNINVMNMTMANADSLWRAVVQRQSGNFFYAVKTTGIYCRPGCASKTPRRENVEFFAGGEEAVRAGYRACKKCRPDQTDATSHLPPELLAACRRLQSEEASLQTLAAEAGMSVRHFHRLFSRHIGVTPKQYAQQARRQKWRDNLRRDGRITDAVYDSGFNSNSRAYENTAADLGMTPAQYKHGAPGERIQYAIAPCRYGLLLAAATGRGICALFLGDNARQLRAEIHRQFFRADVVGGDAAFCAHIRKVAAAASGAQMKFDLPLDIRGTAFQQRVWRALQEIAPGATETYSSLARKIGKPAAVRAVASACAQNPIALAVPCHRVIGKDGSMRGYRWGLERKKKLLKEERAGAK